ncbi:MAG: chemotaxis protein CheB [Acidimicrobiales bacterium]
MGSSWGGLEAVAVVLGSIPADTEACVVIAQHRAPTPSPLAAILGRLSGLSVREAEDKDPVLAGRIYVAPGGYHLLVEKGRLALSTEGPVHHSRPSIDVLLESTAVSYGPDAVGVVFTGSNRDGAAGLAALVARGGRAIVQDPRSAKRSEMPAAALEAVPGATVLSLKRIGALLAELCPAPSGGGLMAAPT